MWQAGILKGQEKTFRSRKPAPIFYGQKRKEVDYNFNLIHDRKRKKFFRLGLRK